MTLVGPGPFVAVVGPSGAGKDSVIAYARARLATEPEFRFVRRVVTRPADPGSEDHDSLSEAEFDRALQAGEFAIAWSAHGHRYGLPTTLETAIRGGATVVANVSRQIIPNLLARYGLVRVVRITADGHVIRSRLLARGREDEAAVETRLARPEPSIPGCDLTEIDNSGALATAGDRFVRFLRATRPEGFADAGAAYQEEDR